MILVSCLRNHLAPNPKDFHLFFKFKNINSVMSAPEENHWLVSQCILNWILTSASVYCPSLPSHRSTHCLGGCYEGLLLQAFPPWGLKHTLCSSQSALCVAGFFSHLRTHLRCHYVCEAISDHHSIYMASTEIFCLKTQPLSINSCFIFYHCLFLFVYSVFSPSPNWIRRLTLAFTPHPGTQDLFQGSANSVLSINIC